MLSAESIFPGKSQLIRFFLFLMTGISSLGSQAQENSPYSRYGLGDMVSDRNMTSRAMGGVAAAYGDFQTIIWLKGVDSFYAAVTEVPHKIDHGVFETGDAERPALVMGGAIASMVGSDVEQIGRAHV